MGDPRIVFVSREVYPFDSAGLGNYVLFTAATLAPVAEVTILTSSLHERRYRELLAARDPRLPDGVRFEFVAEPTAEEAADWYGVLHLWSARAFEALVRLHPDGGPDLVEFPDYLGEACVTAQASQTLDRRLRNTLVCVRAYTTAEMCAVLDGHLPDDRDTRYLTELERFALRHADRFLWPGGDVLGAYHAFYGERGVAPATRVPHTVRPAPEPSAGSGEGDRLRMLYVGRLERRKGVQNLVRAVTALPGSDWSLTMVGGDTPTAPLGQSMRDQLELMVAGDPRIELLDRVPREQLRGLYAGADLCISPSLWECWPNTVLEAFEQNCPVLATPVGGHLGMVEAGASGWLTTGTGADDMVDELERLLGEREEPAALAAGGGPRRRFEELTDPEPVREAYLELSREARARPAAARGDERPLVSIVVPYHRMEGYVAETLASIAAQTHPRIETIVVNDGSLRPEDDILGELAERYPISVVTQVNSGLGQARNLGIELSRGRYVLPLDPDDLILPPFVERCVEVLERRPELAYVTAWSEYMDERGRPLGAGGYRPLGNAVASLERENLAGSAMAVFRRRLFEDGLRYSPDLTSYEDWLVYRELQAAGERGHVIPETLLRYRVRRGSMLRAVAMPGRKRLLGELRAHAREAEVSWTPSNAT
jgi:glycosyltransferase involved in cell wall biosynthesis